MISRHGDARLRAACLTAHLARNRIAVVCGALATIGAAFAMVAAAAGASAADAPGWIGTWAASPQPICSAEFFAPVNIPRALRNQTVRQISPASLGGRKVRIRLAHAYGTPALPIGAARSA